MFSQNLCRRGKVHNWQLFFLTSKVIHPHKTSNSVFSTKSKKKKKYCIRDVKKKKKNPLNDGQVNSTPKKFEWPTVLKMLY